MLAAVLVVIIVISVYYYHTTGKKSPVNAAEVVTDVAAATAVGFDPVDAAAVAAAEGAVALGVGVGCFTIKTKKTRSACA